MREKNHNIDIKLALDNLESSEIISLLLNKLSEKKEGREIGLIKKREIIPLSIFLTPKLSILESIIKYLKEDCKYKFSQIAKVLNRNDRTIWTTYNNANKKNAAKLKIQYSDFDFPIQIFQKTKLSALESMSVFLKNTFDLGFTDIAKLLNRSPKTIWTSHKRALQK